MHHYWETLIFILCRQFLSSHLLYPVGLIDITTIVVCHIIICLLDTFIIIGLAVVAEGFHDGGVIVV